MTSLMAESTVTTGRAWGGQSMVAPLKRVLVRKPAPPAAEDHFATSAIRAPSTTTERSGSMTHSARFSPRAAPRLSSPAPTKRDCSTRSSPTTHR